MVFLLGNEKDEYRTSLNHQFLKCNKLWFSRHPETRQTNRAVKHRNLNHILFLASLIQTDAASSKSAISSLKKQLGDNNSEKSKKEGQKDKNFF